MMKIMNNDNELLNLFAEFNPLPADSDLLFMRRLERRLEAVDELKRMVVVERRRRRWSMILSLFAGFFAGVIASRFLPYIVAWFTSLEIPSVTSEVAQLIGWGATALTALSASILTFDLTAAFFEVRSYPRIIRRK